MPAAALDSLHRRDCAAVITAAGRSSRMGTPKALLDWRGRTLLAHQCLALAGFGARVVVLGYDAERLAARAGIPEGVRTVRNPDWAEGRSTSIAAGLGALEPGWQALLVVAVDQPIAAGVIDALLAAFDPARHTHASPVYGGRRGHPILLSRRLAPELERIRELEQGLRTIVRAHAAEELAVPVAAAAVRLDLNTPDDYADASRVTELDT